MTLCRLLRFTECAVVNSDDAANTKESNFTVIVKNGVGVQVAEKDDILSLIVMIPPQVSHILTKTIFR
jgi:hypothetical protein